MPLGRFFDIGMAVVVLAGVTVAVSSTQFANIILAFGQSFANALKAAMGQFSR